jgi:hypothetical protein
MGKRELLRREMVTGAKRPENALIVETARLSLCPLARGRCFSPSGPAEAAIVVAERSV